MSKKREGIKYRNKINIENLFAIFLTVLFIILLFTLFDFFIHSLRDEYAVPAYYFKNKIIFGTILGFIIYFFIKNKKPFIKSIIFSSIISILLQIRYFLEGYSKTFVFEFLFFHFLMLFLISFIIFWFFQKRKS